MGIPGACAYFHSLICHVSGQSTAAQHLPAPWLVSGTLGRVLCCLLPSPNTVFAFLTYDHVVSPFLSFVFPHHCLFSPQFFFCSHTLLGGREQGVFSFVRDWLRPITFGGKSTRNSDQLQALWEEYTNRTGNQKYLPDYFHAHPLICNLLRQVQSLLSFEYDEFSLYCFQVKVVLKVFGGMWI